MKCDELRIENACVYGPNAKVYLAEQVDAAIAELKEFAEDACLERYDNQNAIDELQAENAEIKKKLMPCLNGDCILTCEVVEKYGKENAELKAKLEDVQASMYCDVVDVNMENRKLRRALWIARAEHYKMREFIAREEGNLCNQMSWSRILRERTYNQWVDQLLRIANLANKLQNKCRAKAEEYVEQSAILARRYCDEVH